MTCDYTPGSLVSVRGREWVVQPVSSPEILRLRPLGGTGEDECVLIPALEPEAPKPAEFQWPDPSAFGTHDQALLLHDALQLKLRAGAGPFRSFGNIAVEPRAYQLVPLLMALRLPVVRLLIADDVGVGKTIEAGLILRELLDRGEISRCAVLCPPHLVDQWQRELWDRFHIRAVALTASTVNRIEKEIPHGVSIFDHYSFAVVSLDYIKSESHRSNFLAIAPECVIVDEAHTCTLAGPGRQLRFELLSKLAENTSRHLVLLTATPHSGNDVAFNHLLSLLKPAFADLLDGSAEAIRPLREDLARHFVQRRRKDIEEWQDESVFPRRMTAEVTYSLTGEWGAFFDAVQAYCVDLASRAEAGGTARAIIWYATLALLRCAASSPAAAERALTTRLIGRGEDAGQWTDDDRLYDGQTDDLIANDLEPAAQLAETEQLEALIRKARSLAGTKGDPKLDALVRHLKGLLSEGFRPVVFCRYVATAHYVANELRARFKEHTVGTITGEFTPEQREERVNTLGESPKPVLVCTDCLSEGVNLQHHFNAVVHYDLAWNPTRHEQREGRVDRFGQKDKEVRCTLLYGQDNPVDGFILQVILRKAEAIRKELGILVPLPEDDERVSQALVKAALMKRKQRDDRKSQMTFDFQDSPDFEAELKPLEARWQDALEKAKANRTVFAQRRLKPDEVLPEWHRTLEALGGENDVKRFVRSACARLNAPLEEARSGSFRFASVHLPQVLRDRLDESGISGTFPLDFHYPPVFGAHFIHRSHPLVSVLADHLLETALEADSAVSAAVPVAARCAATVTAGVEAVTTVFLLRLRHQLTVTRRGQSRDLMAEETVTLAVRGRATPQWLTAAESAALLNAVPSANLPDPTVMREVGSAIDFLKRQDGHLRAVAQERAAALKADHRRVRDASADTGTYEVTPFLPVDVMGVYVLLPDAL